MFPTFITAPLPPPRLKQPRAQTTQGLVFRVSGGGLTDTQASGFRVSKFASGFLSLLVVGWRLEAFRSEWHFMIVDLVT